MQNAKDMKVLGGYGTVGLEVVLSILFGLWLGTKLDDWLGTKPYMAVIWFGFGCAAAGRSIYRTWKSMQAAAKREEAEEGNPAQLFPDAKSLAWQREEDAARREAEEKAAGKRRGSGAEPSLNDAPVSSAESSDAETSLENAAPGANKDDGGEADRAEKAHERREG